VKKPDREQLLYLQRKRTRRAQRISRKKEHRARRSRTRVGPTYKSKTVTVFAPEHFALEQPAPRNATLAFVQRIEHILKAGGNVQINFDKTTLLWPTGTLYFMANLECLLDQYPLRVSCNYPEDPVVEQLFQHVELLQRLGNAPRRVITADNVKHWNYLSGTTVDLAGVKAVFDNFGMALGGDTRAGLFEGLSEAVTNVIQHAYQHVGNGESGQMRWWMFAESREEQLRVAICDLGMGIPRSLGEKPELKERWARLWAGIRKRPHSSLIEIAVESARSRTRLAHRGKGLPDMLKFAKEGEVGGFAIYSVNGGFSYNATSHAESGGDYDQPIRGTIIRWSLPLKT
jgi:hypothetical protein